MLVSWHRQSQRRWVHALMWLIYIAQYIGLFSLFNNELDYWENYIAYFFVNISFFYLHACYVIPFIFRLGGWLSFCLVFIPIVEFVGYFLIYVLISTFFGDLSWNFSTFLPLFEVENMKPFLQSFLAYLFVSSFYGFCRLFGFDRLMQEGRIQIGSHFLNNYLSAIYQFVTKSDEQKAKNGIVWLQEYANIIVDKEYQRPQLLAGELDALTTLVEMKLIASGSGFMFDLIVGEGVASFMLAPLILLTIAENIFQHGVLTQAAFPASLSITLKEGCLEVQAVNLINPSQRFDGRKVGLENIRGRLKLHHRGKHTLSTNEKDGLFQLHLRVWN